MEKKKGKRRSESENVKTHSIGIFNSDPDRISNGIIAQREMKIVLV
jgi:hypothetical protein